MFGVFFYVSLYMQQILGYSPIQAGAAFLPWTLLIILLAPQAGQLSDRFGSRWLVDGGHDRCSPARSSCSRGMGVARDFWNLLPAMLLGGIGHGADDDADDRGGDGARCRATRRASARPC